MDAVVVFVVGGIEIAVTLVVVVVEGATFVVVVVVVVVVDVLVVPQEARMSEARMRKVNIPQINPLFI